MRIWGYWGVPLFFGCSMKETRAEKRARQRREQEIAEFEKEEEQLSNEIEVRRKALLAGSEDLMVWEIKKKKEELRELINKRAGLLRRIESRKQQSLFATSA